MGKADAAKGTWEPKAQKQEPDLAYNRCLLLKLSPLCGMASSPSCTKKIDTTLSPSPWDTEGSLYCAQVDDEVEEIPEVKSATSRPRAASDHSRRSKSTTLVLKNIPEEYGRTGLCEELAANGFGYAIDFLYLPIDPATGKNQGHAFVNVRTKDSTRDFIEAFQNVPTRDCMKAFPGPAILQVSTAEVQGREANMRELCTAENWRVWQGHEEREPLFLDDYGVRISLLPPDPSVTMADSSRRSAVTQCAPEPEDPPTSKSLAVPAAAKRGSLSAKNTPMLAPALSPVLMPLAAPPGLELPEEAEYKLGLERAPSEPTSDSTTASGGEWQMKASAAEFVPSWCSPQMNPKAQEFVPSMPMMIMLPEAELAD